MCSFIALVAQLKATPALGGLLASVPSRDRVRTVSRPQGPSAERVVAWTGIVPRSGEGQGRALPLEKLSGAVYGKRSRTMHLLALVGLRFFGDSFERRGRDLTHCQHRTDKRAGDRACPGHSSPAHLPRGAILVISASVPRMHSWSNPYVALEGKIAGLACYPQL